MKLLKHLIISLIGLAATVNLLFAQEESNQSVPNLIKRADIMYQFGDKPDALELYLEVLRQDSNNLRANFMIGVCHLETLSKAGGLNNLLKVSQIDHDYDAKLNFHIAESYHYGHDFHNAIKYYKDYKVDIKKQLKKKEIKKSEHEEGAKEIKRKIEECHNGIHLMKTPISVQIVDLGENINSPYPDYTPAVNEAENVLVYTSRRHGSTGDLLHIDKLHYEDIYISKKDRNGHWMKSENIGLTINTVSHDAVISISPKGDELFIYKDKGGGDIYESRLNSSGEWTKPEPLKDVNSKAKESHITESPDGNYFIFSSDRKGGYGGLDLYSIERDENGNWGSVKNLGKNINTEYDEESPFLDKVGGLYFSSRGHDGIGGFDIFRSFQSEDKTWSVPENIGFPINTADDDMYYILPGDGKIGYYSSYKSKSYGGKDIYMVEFLLEEEVRTRNSRPLYVQMHDVEMDKPQPVDTIRHEVTIIHGKILDKVTGLPVKAHVSLIDSLSGKVFTETFSDSLSGEYSLVVPSGKVYALYAKKVGYMYIYQYLDLPENVDHDHEELHKDIRLQNLTEGTKVILDNIFFAFDRATLKEESSPELNRFLEVLKDQEGLKIEVSGHTDNLGSADYNKMLSQWRAQAVVDYLVKAGIAESRLSGVGYGMEQPVVSNETFEGRQVNRRIEFKILKGN